MSQYSRLYASLLKSAWAIEPRFAQSWSGQLDRFLVHHQPMALEDEPSQKKLEAVFNIYNEEGVLVTDREQPIPEGSIAVVELIGPMIKYGNWFCWGADEISGFIAQAMANDNIIGIILKVDSGGGAVDAIAPFADVLQNRTKPVVALCDLCASAALYTAIHADHVMAENAISAEFGSIGVMVSFTDYSEYDKKNGIKRHVIYAPESTHKNKPFEMALQGNYELMESQVLSPMARQFQAAVKENRPQLKADVDGILNGRMFYAHKALEYGLIDSIGSMRQALQKVKQLAAAYQLRLTNI